MSSLQAFVEKRVLCTCWHLPYFNRQSVFIKIIISHARRVREQATDIGFNFISSNDINEAASYASIKLVHFDGKLIKIS